MTSALALVFVPIAALTAGAVCGPSAVCGDVISSYTGGVVDTTIVLTWTSDDESNIASYKVYRCVSAGNCPTLVATVTATGSCGTAEPYQVEDSPPSSPHSYSLEVWTITPSLRACAVDTIPQ